MAQIIFFSLVCFPAVGGCECSSSQNPKEFEIASPSNGKPHEIQEHLASKNTLEKRQEDMDCAFKLARVYVAISNIRFNFDMPDGYIPSQKDMEWMAKYLYRIIPRCPRASIVGQEGVSYYVATAGPTPTTRRDILAYEVAGNHGTYRHILFRAGIKCISEEEWERMLKDQNYRPAAPVLLFPHSELMDLRPYIVGP